MTDQTIRFRTDMTVKLVEVLGSDLRIVEAARVSTIGGPGQVARSFDNVRSAEGLIDYLMKHRHGSPFEHGVMTFYIEAPIFVFRELMRHRIASYNETSARYRDLEPVFYLPDRLRGLLEPESKARPICGKADEATHSAVAYISGMAYGAAWQAYREMRERGVASEVARQVLPVGIYSSAYMTVNLRSLMNILSLRIRHADATYETYPQHEITDVAREMERHFMLAFPKVHKAFISHGRVAP